MKVQAFPKDTPYEVRMQAINSLARELREWVYSARVAEFHQLGLIPKE